MRCRTLARFLSLRGCIVHFICRSLKGDLSSLLAPEFSLFILPEVTSISNDTSELCNHTSLHPVHVEPSLFNQEIDAYYSFDILKRFQLSSNDLIIVDHYSIDILWEKTLLSLLRQNRETLSQPRMCVIDDLSNRQHCCDILIDQNYCPPSLEHRYDDLLPSDCTQFLGPHYALLSPEYAHLSCYSLPRLSISRILVFFGGSDQPNASELVLDVLSLSQFKHFAVDIVVGFQYQHKDSLAAKAQARPSTTIWSQLDSLAPLIFRADICIGAGGGSTWERLCLELPTLQVSIADNQVSLSEALDNSGFISYCGPFESLTFESFRETLSQFISNSSHLKSGKLLTDGFGSHRLATALLGLNGDLSLRNVSFSDEFLLLRWANDPIVRKYSLCSDYIDPATHHQWLYDGLKSSNRLHFIAIDSASCPVGQIRFDLYSSSDYVTISFSLDKAFRGLGLSSKLLSLGISRLHLIWGTELPILAKVLSSNLASSKCFAKFGFQLDPSDPPEDVQSWWYRHTNP